ncbi:MAG TPA: Hsp20/alpha crystallin family protein [candidate division Zixibacteria bacterium]|nr:Hsp20/alpha crystallin family protein [candidate division Zixibacteria bacterium]
MEDASDTWQRGIESLLADNTWLPSIPFIDRTERFSPRVNISDRENEIEISVELPGLEENDIELSLSRDILTLKGKKKQESEERDGTFYRMERKYGSFCRSISIPSGVVDADKADAVFTNGVLTINLPKREKEIEVSKRIAINSEQ